MSVSFQPSLLDVGAWELADLTEVARTPLADDPARHEVRFADTMTMSTYLVAFIVGPLEATDPVDVDGTPLRVVYPKGKGHLTDFALEVGASCLRHFTAYYGIPYPGDKLDLVAVPDFAFGAMENLGCVTFREVLLLVDPAEVTQAELLNVTDVINHELAHMWFGDLVTMKWWNGLWLNEAFATFMELAAVDAYKPEWQRWVAFTNERAAAFAIDSLASTRPIEFPVRSPHEADGMFDLLTYQKGASVLRMLEQYLGADGFRAGIRRYLKAREYGNAETTDLWDAIEEATGEPVRRIMDTWIFQGGHPIVSVSADGDTLTLSQKQLLVALAEPLLRRDGTGMSAIPSSADAAARLGWTVTRFNRKLDNVCDKFDRIGVPGMRGGAGGSATNRRARLVEHVIASRLVGKADLALLDATETDPTDPE